MPESYDPKHMSQIIKKKKKKKIGSWSIPRKGKAEQMGV